MKAQQLRPILAMATAALLLAACGGGNKPAGAAVSGNWDELVAAAKKEGKVTIYSSQSPTNLEGLKKAFGAKYPGITMEFVRAIDSDGATKIEAEKQTGNATADVYVTATGSWIRDVGTPGRYATPVKGPNFDNAAYDRAKSVQDDKYFLVGAAVLGFGWNTNAFPEGIKSYSDLLNPKLQGKIGVVQPASGSYVDFYKFVEANAGKDFLPALAKLKPRVYPSTLPVSQALTSGELAAALVVQPLIAEKASGAPVGWSPPNPVWGARWVGMTLSAAPHPNAAQLLADFMVTPEGQTASSNGYAAALPDITGSVKNAQEVAKQDLSLQTPDAIKAYQQEWAKLFQ